MAFWGWLFGGSSLRGGWELSENGNPTVLKGSSRLTVFAQDRGWKFCISDVEDRGEPYFSEAYETKRQAQEEALSYVRGDTPRHQPLSVGCAENRRHRWEAHIRARDSEIEELQKYLETNTDLRVTELRKPEAKIASLLKQIGRQTAEYERLGVSAKLLRLNEHHRSVLTRLGEGVAGRVSALQSKRSPRKPPVSNSRLPPNLAEKVDELIALFAGSPVMDSAERQNLYRETRTAVMAKMIDDGLSYGEVSRGPAFLNQDEESFRAFMKDADQSLSWQCDTVTEAFERYLNTGETPAPHYPKRIAILLSKAKDFEREKQFLAAWCRHFPAGNGVTYGQLVERAKKTGAIES